MSGTGGEYLLRPEDAGPAEYQLPALPDNLKVLRENPQVRATKRYILPKPKPAARRDNVDAQLYDGFSDADRAAMKMY